MWIGTLAHICSFRGERWLSVILFYCSPTHFLTERLILNMEPTVGGRQASQPRGLSARLHLQR